MALEKFGYKIIATDYSEDMLACARRKAISLCASTEFQEARYARTGYSRQAI